LFSAYKIAFVVVSTRF